MYFVLLGAPGAGKGTQAEVMVQKLELVHLASGDLFRESMAKGTELGKQVKTYVERGLLVPDDITIRLIMERLNSLKGARGVLLDGFPRTIAQAQALDTELKRKGKEIDQAVYIQVSSGELVSRLSERWICRQCQTPYNTSGAPPRVAGKCDKCGGDLYQRADDKPETVKKRLEVYFAETTPLIEYYRNRGKLMLVNGEQSVEAVSRELLGLLQDRQPGRTDR